MTETNETKQNQDPLEALGLVDATIRRARNGALFAQGTKGAISLDGKKSRHRNINAGANAVGGKLSLHNAKEPTYDIVYEKPEHRFLVYLRAQGLSVKDIFLKLGGELNEDKTPKSGTGQYCYNAIRNICRQPWFTERVVTVMEEAGKDHVAAVLEAQLVPSIEKLIELRDTSEKDTVRLQASNSLIDRVLGRATQVVRSDSTITYKNAEDEKAALEAEEERLKSLAFN